MNLVRCLQTAGLNQIMLQHKRNCKMHAETQTGVSSVRSAHLVAESTAGAVTIEVPAIVPGTVGIEAVVATVTVVKGTLNRVDIGTVIMLIGTVSLDLTQDILGMSQERITCLVLR